MDIVVEQEMKRYTCALEIDRQTHLTSFSCRSRPAAQRELAEAQHFFNDPDHGFDGTFSEAINRVAIRCLKLLSHLSFGLAASPGGSGNSAKYLHQS